MEQPDSDPHSHQTSVNHVAEHEHTDDPLRPHSHDPNMEPPSDDPTIDVRWPGGQTRLTVGALRALPSRTVAGCYIVSTGHGVSGPFSFTGVPLLALIVHLMPSDLTWDQVALVSGDGFGTRLFRNELMDLPADRPALLAYSRDDLPLTRKQGLVRLIEPNEADDALRQVKWIARVEIH